MIGDLMVGRANDPCYGMARHEGEGALRWCVRCSRHHKSQTSCNLVFVERRAKSGKNTYRLAHIERADG